MRLKGTKITTVKPINVKTVEQIGSNFFEEPQHAINKGLWMVRVEEIICLKKKTRNDQ